MSYPSAMKLQKIKRWLYRNNGNIKNPRITPGESYETLAA